MKSTRDYYEMLVRAITPKVFYESSFFDRNGTSADIWYFCWVAEKIPLSLFLLAAYAQIWWLLPILFFPTVMLWSVRGTIKNKAGSGYPYLEVGDMLGIGVGGVLYGAISLVWFIWAL